MWVISEFTVYISETKTQNITPNVSVKKKHPTLNIFGIE